MNASAPTLVLLCALSSCGIAVVLHSGVNSADPSGQGSAGGGVPSVDPSASPLFASAQAVFQSRCVFCHASFSTNTEAQWVVGGSVVPAHPDQSTVFSILKGAGVGGLETMPQAGALSSAELDTLRNWILNISDTAGQSISPAQRRWLQAQSVVSAKCVSCHSTQSPRFQASSEVEMLTHTSLVRPGRASTSTLVTISQSGNMPPSPRPALTSTELQIITNWISEIGLP